MNKNIFVTMIAGAFFAAGAVGPAFAGDGTQLSAPEFDLIDSLPELKIDDRLRNAGNMAERLRDLDLGTVLDKAGAPSLPHLPVAGPVTIPDTLPELAPVELPKVDLTPEIEPLEPPELAGPVTVPEVPVVNPAEERVVESEGPDVAKSENREQRVRAIVADRKAEKAAILEAHGGDRRAAKAELKAAQKRMVERIHASNGAASKGKAKGRNK